MSCTENSVDGKKTFSKMCYCGKQFRASSTYYEHKKSCEDAQMNVDTRLGHFICKEGSCEFRCKLSKQFTEHLKNMHHIETTADVHYFEKYSDFTTWKENFEKKTKALFVLRNKKQSSRYKKEYYYCNRSGHYTTQSKGKRNMKYQGLRKIGFSCPASIIVYVDEMNEDIRATVLPLHYGHNNDLRHVPIPKSDRAYLATQLLKGVEKTQILENITSEEREVEERRQLCTRRDLLNISRAYGIDTSKKEIRRSEEHQEALDVLYEITITTTPDQGTDEDLTTETKNEKFETVSCDVEVENSCENNFFLEYVDSDRESAEILKSELLHRYDQLREKIEDCDNEDLLSAIRHHIDSVYDLLSTDNGTVQVTDESSQTCNQNGTEILVDFF